MEGAIPIVTILLLGDSGVGKSTFLSCVSTSDEVYMTLMEYL